MTGTGRGVIVAGMTSDDQNLTLLIITDDCLAPSHGTGAALLRHLHDVPRENLLHFYLNRKGDPFLPSSWQVAPGSRNHQASWVDRVLHRAPPTSADCLTIDDAIAAATAGNRQIDLVYSAVFGEHGLMLLQSVIDRLPPSTPVIHHAMDFLYVNRRTFENLLREVTPRVTEYWAIGRGMTDEIKRVTGRDARLVPPFQSELRLGFKTEHRPFTPSTRAVMLGNSHMAGVLHHLGEVWGNIRRETPGLEPIQWYAYPSSVTYVRNAGVVFEPHIEYYGFLNDRRLFEHLIDADFAVVPFNIEDTPEYHYAQYSIPSRITELMNAGLPIFAAAGRRTEAYHFLTANNIGVCSTLADAETFQRELVAFARDRDQRAAYGARARAYAEATCDVRAYRKDLNQRLRELATRAAASSSAT